MLPDPSKIFMGSPQGFSKCMKNPSVLFETVFKFINQDNLWKVVILTDVFMLMDWEWDGLVQLLNFD